MKRLGCLGCSGTLGVLLALPVLSAATDGFARLDALLPAGIGLAIAAVLRVLRSSVFGGGGSSSDEDLSRLVA